jgi:uncharacterized membrane protein YidH (DUF202 family)
MTDLALLPVRIGLILLAAGATLDIIVHASSTERLSSAGLPAHLVTLAGMVLTLLGVLQAAIARRNRRRVDERR